MDSFHRRPLPADLVAFGQPEGRALLRASLAEGTAEAFFPLSAHLHTQAEPAWCGFGTLITVLNALEIDPGRVWKGPWRFFGEELLVCCKALELAASEGFTLAEVACLAQCNGARVDVFFAEPGNEGLFRETVLASVRAPSGPFVVCNYDRGALGQTGSGHFSPLAAWHEGTDRALILDVARFKYPPHWAPMEKVWQAMTAMDPTSGRPRGWLVIDRTTDPVLPEGTEALVARLRALGAPMCPPPPDPTP